MGLKRYVSASMLHMEELGALLTKEEIVQLADALRLYGLSRWEAWMSHNSLEVARFVAGTPSERRQMNKRTGLENSLLILAALTHCNHAYDVLGVLQRYQHDLPPGTPYRHTTSIAGSIYEDILNTYTVHWPFEFEWACSSPFE